MNLKITLIASAILLLSFVALTWTSGPPRFRRKPDLTCAMIHEPPQGCPEGYVKEKQPRFVEKDGSKEFACLDQTGKKERCIDVLKPGEGVGMTIEIELPPEKGPKT